MQQGNPWAWTPEERAAVMQQMGVPMGQGSAPMGPPEPTKAEWINRANQGQPGALKRLEGDSARYTGGPMMGKLKGAWSNDDGRSLPEPAFNKTTTQNPEEDKAKWEEFKNKLQGKKVDKSGADVNKTGSVTNPTGKMEDDEALGHLKTLIDNYEKGKKKIDLSPLIALTDSWTGSRLLQGYDKPLGDEERDQILLNLKGKLYQQEADLKYKKAYLAQTAEAERARQDFRERQSQLDRQNKIDVEKIKVGGMLARTQGSANSGQRDISNKSRFLKENKHAVAAIAKSRFGNPNDEEDRSYEFRIGALNDEIYETGKELEQNGMVKPGMGYNAALQWYLKNSAGPDGAGGPGGQ